MFWFKDTREGDGSEKFLEVSEEFEVKDNQWHLSKIKTHLTPNRQKKLH